MNQEDRKVFSMGGLEYEKALRERKNQEKVNRFSPLISKYAAYTSIEDAINMALDDIYSEGRG